VLAIAVLAPAQGQIFWQQKSLAQTAELLKFTLRVTLRPLPILITAVKLSCRQESGSGTNIKSI